MEVKREFTVPPDGSIRAVAALQITPAYPSQPSAGGRCCRRQTRQKCGRFIPALTDVDVALKIPNDEILSDPANRHRSVREVEAWTDLGLHPELRDLASGR